MAKIIPLFNVKKFIKKSWIGKKYLSSSYYQIKLNPSAYYNKKANLKFYKRLLATAKSRKILIFDVGANLGQKSVIFSKIAKQVIAFEPTTELVKKLEEKFKGTNVKIIHSALGSSNSCTEMYIINDNQAYNSLQKKHIETTTNKRGIANLSTVGTQKVNIETLEENIKKFGLPVYIKIDVEGYEFEVLSGLRTPVPIISFEVNLPEFRDEGLKCINYIQRLSSKGYKFNFTTDIDFLNSHFLEPEAALHFIRTTDLEYLEVYARQNI